MTSLAIVTCTTDLARARPCLESWARCATEPHELFIVLNGGSDPISLGPLGGGLDATYLVHHGYLGSVPAFRKGVDRALKSEASIIACLHDDFEILESGWDEKVAKYFDRHPAMGLAGFGGAVGLGEVGMYDRPYDPMSLARHGFRSNLVDAEAHGLRSLLAERVACLDGFSQVGYRGFWEGHHAGVDAEFGDRPWTLLEELGIIHHAYDGMMACLAARYGWETWYLPLRSQHWGGRTAVGDQGYASWAKQQNAKGDQGLWEQAHRIWYDNFRDVLPLQV